jgi:hypothetical protein
MERPRASMASKRGYCGARSACAERSLYLISVGIRAGQRYDLPEVKSAIAENGNYERERAKYMRAHWRPLTHFPVHCPASTYGDLIVLAT